jgi:hypothetical protein
MGLFAHIQDGRRTEPIAPVKPEPLPYATPGNDGIRRVNRRSPAPVEFKGGPSPRIPDSLFLPPRQTMHPMGNSSPTQVINPGFGYRPAPFLHSYIPRIIPFNIKDNNTIIMQPKSTATPLNLQGNTVRVGAPPNLATLIPPLGS